MELAAAVLLGKEAIPLAFNSSGARLIEMNEWTRFQSEIAARLRAAPDSVLFAVHRPKDRSPCLFWITRLTGFGRIPDDSYLCFVFDLERQPAIGSAVLKEAFRLTRAELRLSEQLLLGKTPAEAAAALGVTIHTVRTYLKRLYHKVGARSQATLVRKLMQAAAMPVLIAA